MFSFSATLEIIGVNPFVFVPEPILLEIFNKAGKTKGPIPVSGNVNGKLYKQTLVRYQGQWRLYINLIMLKNSPKRIGETIDVSIDYDPVSRELSPSEDLMDALSKDKKAKDVFDSLIPSKQKEIIRYIHHLKTAEARDKNIKRAINFLLGKERFIGRDKP